MKHIKTFEHLYKNPIFVGLADYVLIDFENKLDKSHKLINFIERNIGQIIDIDGTKRVVWIKFDNMPDINIYKDDIKFRKYIRLNNDSITINKDWISYSSQNKEDIELYLNQKKYNL